MFLYLFNFKYNKVINIINPNPNISIQIKTSDIDIKEI